MSLRRFLATAFILTLALVAAAPVAAQGPASARVAEVSAAGSSVDFRPLVEGDRYVLTVSGPDGKVFRREFDGSKTPTFALGQRPDGVYNWELTVAPHVDKALRREIENARKSDNAERARDLMAEAGMPKATLVQSGAFTVAGGQVMSSDIPERRPRAAEKLVSVTAEDQVIPDDLIVQGSECVGFDCVNNEPFGFDTIRLKENNLRILFMDTSVGTFPTNDWQLVANDSASGGQSKFSIEDVTGARIPFTVEAGATANSIYVDSTGRVGFRTSTPVLDLHVATGNTPALRLEQNNSSGFTAQTWDIGANEANFFVRDVTGGSLLPFRIRPGAPTSSVDISADGDVGIGTASPSNKLHVKVNTAGQGILIDGDQITTDVSVNMTMQGDSAGFILNDLGGGVNQKVAQQFVNGNEWRIRGLNDAAAAETVAGVVFSLVNGNVGVNCTTAPGADLVVDDGGACNAGTRSELNAGATQFTVPSSRTLKENFAPVEVDGILEKIDRVKVYSYDFIDGPKDRIGLVAEDFHTVFGRGSDKKISGDEIQLAMWLAIQELSAQNAELRRELDDLKQRE